MKLKTTKKRQSGVSSGHAGEYFVMGELLRRDFDAQLADRNTTGYDILFGRKPEGAIRRLEVKTVRKGPWYQRQAAFLDGMLDRLTIYVLLGEKDAKKPVRFFITRNRDVKEHLHIPKNWKLSGSGYIPFKAVEQYENRWGLLS